MAVKRTIVSVAAAAVIALAAVVFISNSPASEPRTALAGPCGADPLLFFSPIAAPPADVLRLPGAEAGLAYQETFEVVTDPETLPDGKPPVTIKIFETDPGSGHAGIGTSFNPSESDGSFTTTAVTGIAQGVPAGVYEYEIEIECHGGVTTIPYTVFVGVCPGIQGGAGFQISGNGTPTPTPLPFPLDCEEPTPTPTPPAATPSPTPSPTATSAPTPTAPPGQQVTWADNNCKDGVNPVDSLLVLRGDAGLSANTGDCPPMGANIDVQDASPHIWGNVDCKDGMTPVDSLKILRHDAGLSVSQEPACPAMGSAVTITLS